MLLDLQDLFNGVVDHEDDEDSLACHHEVVQGGDVTDQFHRTEVERRDATTSGRVLKQESGQRWNSFSISLEVQCKPIGEVARQSTGNLTFVTDLQSNPVIMDTVMCYIFCFYFSLVECFQHEPLAWETGRPLPMFRSKRKLYLYLLIYS